MASEAAAVMRANRFAAINGGSIDEQARVFLRAFFGEFEGRIAVVLDLAAEFKGYAPPENAGEASELDEHMAHLFLERAGQTLTVAELRRYLSEVDVDSNNKVSFLEHALYEFGVSVDKLLSPAISMNDPKWEACARQIEEYFAGRAAFEDEEQRLEAAAGAAEGSVVARRKAALDLQLHRKRATIRNREAIKAVSNERAAKKAAEAKIEAELAANSSRAAEAQTLKRARGKAKILERGRAFLVDGGMVRSDPPLGPEAQLPLSNAAAPGPGAAAALG